MNDKEFSKQMAKARKRVAEFDRIDGWAPRDPKTIAAALECGLKKPNTGAAFDALVMLQDLQAWGNQ